MLEFTESRELRLNPEITGQISESQLLIQEIQAAAKVGLSALMALWQGSIRPQRHQPEVYQTLGDVFLLAGEPLIGYDVLAEGRKYWPQNLRIRQLLALALARSGATISANLLLQELVKEQPRNEETLGLLARTHKDLWIQATATASQRLHLRLAAQYYQQAYQINQSIWTGINAATMALLQGKTEYAQAFAQQVRGQCLVQLETIEPTADHYWLLATLGEAALILQHESEAADYYGQAVEVGHKQFGNLSSSRRNALLIAQCLKIDSSLVNGWFQLPRVVVFCGHMIDQPGRAVPRFPPSLEPRVYEAICDRLLQLNACLGYASAACGSDILFLEALLALKGELHIVLPFQREQFIQDSIEIVADGSWRDRFERVIAKAAEVIVAPHRKTLAAEVSYEYSHRLLHGLAKIRARQLGTDLLTLTVWNGQLGDNRGGTASAVSYWRQWSEEVDVIDLAALLKQSYPTLALRSEAEASVPKTIVAPTESISRDRQIRALLFADVVDFAKLAEEQFIPFVDCFLSEVAELSNRPAYRPLLRNTWGDALYFVFARVQQAGSFALALCSLIQRIDWAAKGLPPDLNLRIALHAGPVHRSLDPISGQENYMGTHVNYAARIEPITPPGKVYASQAFAAIAASEGIQDFSCEYVGQTPYAKQYGTFPTYHVRPDRSGF
ncbi:MAG: adenylate/guanylate cyclase domain-containing protein [Leptolyngbyaceae cyanobacterium SL_1_1]|nr:adenylate/guanylate cyclase domain-containing protein [Leptolyngbyaceae cyanobacterium RM1_1_2]NJO09785.1 adenylate/guanylate cyclase domain-containing protein [Leptolyngbyaceae cyanobacterium SL_1_1]